MLIDLHTHSQCSDGLLTVEELVKLAARKKVKILALTDHDTTIGLPSFIKICAQHKIESIPGLELSTAVRGVEMHLVGYLKNFNDPKLLAILKKQQAKRMERAKILIKRFRSLNFVITKTTEKQLLSQKNTGKPQFTRAILKEQANLSLLKNKYGWQGNLSDFIGSFLDRPGQIGYLKKQRLNSLAAIELIKKCGGLVSLAHPDIELAESKTAQKIIPLLVKAGLWGMEMPHNFLKNKKHLLPLAEKYKLAITYGSDSHDGKRLGINVGKTEWQKIDYLLN